MEVEREKKNTKGALNHEIRLKVVLKQRLRMPDRGCEESITDFFEALENQVHRHCGNSPENYRLGIGTWFRLAEMLQPWTTGIKAHAFYRTKFVPEESKSCVAAPAPMLEEAKYRLPSVEEMFGLKELRRAVICPYCRKAEFAVTESTKQCLRRDEGATSTHTCNNPECGKRWRES